jgi:hypothetical protein
LINIPEIQEILTTEYPVTETLVGIFIGLILPLLICVMCCCCKYKNHKNKKIATNSVHTLDKIHNEKYIEDDIKNILFQKPEYTSTETYKAGNLYEKYPTEFHDYITETYNKNKLIIDNYEPNKCCKCHVESKKLFQTKYNLYVCEKCDL